jgi:hypothetical protein
MFRQGAVWHEYDLEPSLFLAKKEWEGISQTKGGEL